MRISIDTDVDTFTSAVQAVHAAYGVPYDPKSAPADDEVEGLEDQAEEEDFVPNSGDDFFPGKWNRKRIRKLAQWVSGGDAEIALRYMAEHAPAVDIDEVFEHMSQTLGMPDFNGQNMGGRMSSVGFAYSSIKGGVGTIYDTDYKHRKYRMDSGIAKVLLEELDAIKS